MTNEEIVKELQKIIDCAFTRESKDCLMRASIVLSIDNLISKLSPPKPKFLNEKILFTIDGKVVKNLGLCDCDKFAYELLELPSGSRYWHYECDLLTYDELIEKFGGKHETKDKE